MPMQNFQLTVFSLGVLFAGAFADNPISNYHYLADPAAAASDSVFYILTDSDDPAGADIKSMLFGKPDAFDLLCIGMRRADIRKMTF